MTLNFPSSPSDQDTYSGYVYNAAKGVWKKIASTTDNISEGSTNLYFTDQRALDATSSAYDAAGSAATAESNANTYTDSLIGDGTVDGTSGNTVTDRIATAVSSLVDSAPETLDTLNELAAAIDGDPEYFQSISQNLSFKADLDSPSFTGTVDFTGATVNGIDALPSQDGQSGKYLTTDGSEALWADLEIPAAGADDNAIFKATLFFGGNA
jgi:hypothetical protein